MALSNKSSEMISRLRLPLIVGIVLFHTNPSATETDGWTLHNIASTLGCISLYTLAFISGYFFFVNFQSVKESYIRKIRSRISSLLVPYLFWNAWMLLVYFCIQQALPGHTITRVPDISSLDIHNLLLCFWGLPGPYGDMPLCPQFWFIKYLLAAYALSPILYLFIKRLRWLSLAIFLILLFAPENHFTIITYFAIGAYLSINKKEIADIPRCSPAIPTAVLAAFIVGDWLFNPGIGWLNTLSYTAGAYAALCWARLAVDKSTGTKPCDADGCAFFIFAFHNTVVQTLNTLWRSLHIDCDIIGYIAITGSTVAICVALYLAINRLLPTFTAIICGNRNAR